MFGDLVWNHDDSATVRARLSGLCHMLLGIEDFARDSGVAG